jgi:hypothetical protein
MNKPIIRALLFTAMLLPCAVAVYAQPNKEQANSLPLTDLSAFANPPKNWQVTGKAHADLDKANTFMLTKGTGVLVNGVDEKNPGRDIYTTLQHGDLDLEFDYMMAKGANSGIYLQGRYEIQLLDSWGVINPKSSDNGGIYERWDESKPDGQKGYEGHAPRQNAGRAPGLWQHMKISFEAPGFDDKGSKISNAKVLGIWLNGILIQENAELSGPTRGAFDNKEAATGPLRFQGDHGAVAFRNISYTNFDKPHPTLSALNYAVYKGAFSEEPDYKKLKPEASGSSLIISPNDVKLDNNFLVRYTGLIHITQPGEYTFKLSLPGGQGLLRIDGKVAVPLKEYNGTGKITLQAGDLPFDLFYSKTVDWAKPALGLRVSGPGIREYLLTDANVSSNDAIDPILINATENTILRSFTDVPNKIRVTHGINVGSTDQMHYTYDNDKGMIVQGWHGGFLDATPMWHERGDGSSRPAGSVIYFGTPAPQLATLPTPETVWPADTTGSGYRPKGYVLDSDGRPVFKYLITGNMITDASTVTNGQELHREITAQTPATNLWARVATGNNIEQLKNGLYLIDDKYYIRLENAESQKPQVRTAGGGQELIVPVQSKLTYSIIY